MMLSQEQLDAYYDQGFTLVPNLFSAEDVAVMRAELERLKGDGVLRNVSTAGDGETPTDKEINLQVCPLSPVSETFRALPFSEQVSGVLQQLYGDKPAYHRLDQIFLKPAKNGAGTGWHQDNAYFTEAQGDHCTDGFGMWIALHDATVANGTMHVIPKRHQEVLEHSRDGGSDHHITCAAVVNDDDAVAVELAAGGALIFNYGVPHCTKANTTDHERAGLALHFLLESNAKASQRKMHGPLLNTPENDGGMSLWGEDLRGRWAQLTEAVV